jgi:hypothetical protein
VKGVHSRLVSSRMFVFSETVVPRGPSRLVSSPGLLVVTLAAPGGGGVRDTRPGVVVAVGGLGSWALGRRGHLAA